MVTFDLSDRIDLPSDSNRGSEGGTSSSLTRRKRERVRRRDGGTCQNCDSISNLEVHHIVPRMVGGTHTLSNLVTLCGECHQKVTHPHQDGTTECMANTYLRLQHGVKDVRPDLASESPPTTCDNCGEEGEPFDDIQAHFIVPSPAGGSRGESNVSYLCSVCHSATHGTRRYARTSDSYSNDGPGDLPMG